jgi:hypothetical protein
MLSVTSNLLRRYRELHLGCVGRLSVRTLRDGLDASLQYCTTVTSPTGFVNNLNALYYCT